MDWTWRTTSIERHQRTTHERTKQKKKIEQISRDKEKKQHSQPASQPAQKTPSKINTRTSECTHARTLCMVLMWTVLECVWHYYSYFFSLAHLLKANTCQWTVVIEWYASVCVCVRAKKIIPFFECGFNFAAICFFYFGIRTNISRNRTVSVWLSRGYISVNRQVNVCDYVQSESMHICVYVHMNCIELGCHHVPHSNMNKQTKWTVNYSFVLFEEIVDDWSVKKTILINVVKKVLLQVQVTMVRIAK